MSDGIILRGEVRPSPPAGDQLMRGLIFMRANTMNMIRLQLAMERGDRRVALETVDELVALDSRMRELLETGAAAGSDIRELQRVVDQQRLSLSLEKLGLAAGIRSRSRPIDRNWIEPGRVAAPPDAPMVDVPAIEEPVVDPPVIEAAVIDPASIDDWQSFEGGAMDNGEPASNPRPWRMLTVCALLMLLSAMVLGAVIQGAYGPLIAAWLSEGAASWPM
jgi:hypothetical protein